MTTRRPIILLSPFRGGDRRCRDYLIAAMADSIAQGEAPFASHMLYPSVLEDRVPEERAKGFECESAWLLALAADPADVAPRIVVYCDLGISEGMRNTLNSLGTGFDVVFRTLRGWDA